MTIFEPPRRFSVVPLDVSLKVPKPKEIPIRKLNVSVMVSLDGVMQAPGGPEEDPTGGFKFGGWTWAQGDEVTAEAIRELFAKPFDLLLGRKTYEIFAAYWPQQENGPAAHIARAFNETRKYVATSSKAPLTWNNSVAIHDVAAEIARLKKEDGPDLLVQGSSNLIQSLLQHDLIDSMNMRIYPLLLGKGKRVFGDGTKPQALKLQSSKVSPSGVTIQTYTPAGPVKLESRLAAPSPEELARRERLKHEG
jgi:dihydrofolate reductase